MHSSTIISSLFAIIGLACAAPLTQARQVEVPYYGVSIGVITSDGLDPTKVLEPAPVEINKLTPCHGGNNEGCSVSELIVQNGTASNVDIDSIECRAYKDFAGVVPGSAPFNVSHPALVSTNLATISSILCYIVPVPST
jgi:hypothetical protein